MKTKLLKGEVEFFIKEQYPLTVIADRYGGCYSGAKYLAFPREYYDIEDAVSGSDPDCMLYWDKFDDIVGKGATIEDAVDNLLLKMMREAADGFVHCTTLKERLRNAHLYYDKN